MLFPQKEKNSDGRWLLCDFILTGGVNMEHSAGRIEHRAERMEQSAWRMAHRAESKE